jgi:hypothetical protein
MNPEGQQEQLQQPNEGNSGMVSSTPAFVNCELIWTSQVCPMIVPV